MRWIFLTLLLLNVLFAVVEWSSRLDKYEVQNMPYRIIEGGVRLTMLGEPKALQGDKDLLAEIEVAEPLCLLLGPLDNKGEATELLSLFQRKEVKAELVAQSIKKAPNYWVYLAPFDNRRAAITRLKELQSAKVDSYLITQGELANGISLGVFENIDSARRMSERRKGQGYDVKVSELGKSDFEYWVAILEEYAEELDFEVAKIASKFEESFEKRQIFCKSVASEK